MKKMKKRILSIILLAVFSLTSLMSPAIVGAAENDAGMQIIASDDFSDGMSGWGNQYGDDFFVLGEKLNVSSDGGRFMSTAVASDISLDNCEVEFDMNIKSGSGYFAVLPRYMDETTFYAIKFYPGSNKIVLHKRVNGGSYTDIKTVKYSIDTNKDYRVRLSLSGIKLGIYIDGGLVLSAEDYSIPSGRLALGASEASASVDNILVYRLKEVNYEENVVVKEPQKLYVAVDGDDKNGDGSEGNPYATIAKAKSEAVRLNNKNNPVDVIFKEGIYRQSSTLQFTDADSGTAGAPIRFVAEAGAEVIFTGAKAVDTSKFEPVDEATAERLRQNVRGKVLKVDLGRQGFKSSGLNFTTGDRVVVGQRIKPLNITLNHELQSIARWPNSGYVEVTDCDNSKPPKIFYTNNIPTRWANAKNFFIDGYLYHDWAPEWALVDSVDTLTNSINFKNKTSYGVRVGGKWAAVNLLEELDIPGEWYIDFDTMTMYYYPPHDLTEDDLLEIGTSTGYLVNMNGVSNIEFDGIHFTMAGGANGTGIIITGGSKNIVLKDCTVDNVTRHGIRILADDITVDGCTISHTGESGVHIEKCGNTETLEEGNVIVKNCDISHPSLYAGGNGTAGLTTAAASHGATVINNVIHNCNNSAIRYHGTGHRFAYNEFYNVMVEAADAGAIYTGRNWTYYGNVAEYNLFHDLGQKVNTTQYSAASMFWDDLNNGGEFSHNITVLDGGVKKRGVSMGGGSDNIIMGNTTVGAEVGVSANDRKTTVGYEAWETYANGTLKYNIRPVKSAPYVAKYPKMGTILDRIKENDGVFIRENVVTDNLHVDCETPLNLSENMTKDSDIARNIELNDVNDIFVNPADLDYRVKKSAKAQYGISGEILDEDFDINSIGIQGEGKRVMEDSKMAFNMLYPHNGDTSVTLDRVDLAWSKAYLADRYTYTVAEDPEFTKIVAQDDTIKTSAQIKGLLAGKTYYWKVTAHNLSRQYGCDIPAPEGVWSFTIDANAPLDLTGLKQSVSNAQTVVKTLKESGNPGDYRVGSVKAIKEKIRKGQSYLELTTGDQNVIDEAAFEINRSITNLEGYINPGYTTLDVSASAPWVTNKSVAEKTKITKENGQIRIDVGAKSEISLNETLSNYNVMCFKTKVDNFDNKAWFAYGLRALSTETNIYSQNAYYILIKEGVFELQKAGEIYKTAPNNGKFKAGQWHDIKFGSITTENGINMYFELDGEVIFDYLDKSSPQKRPGMFAIYASTASNVIELAPADNVPAGVYTFSDAILREISTDAAAGDTLGVDSDGYSERGTWNDNTVLKGENDSPVRSGSGSFTTATWTMNVGKNGNGKLYKVYYYHIPSETGDKNVKVKLSGYNGEYNTTVDMSQGTAGWVELGTFSFMDADYNGRLEISFDSSGEGEVNVSNVKFELANGGEDLLK